MKIGYIGVCGSPKIVEIHPDKDGGYLHSMQALVGGRVEYFTPLYDSAPALIINDESLINGMPPNRAVYATKRMAEAGFCSQLDCSNPVKEGELYTILFGPILAVSNDWDEDGNEILRDITAEEFCRLCRDFEDVGSGLSAVLSIVEAAFSGEEG